jgi:hypothetical protein
MTQEAQQQQPDDEEEILDADTEGDGAPETPEGEADDQPEEQEPDSTEARARRMGWRPKEEYKGTGKWVDAAEFLKQVEDDYPRMKKANMHMERKIDKLEKGMEAILEHQQRELTASEERAYQRAMEDYKRKMQQAVEEGDAAKAEKALAGATSLIEQKAQAATKKAQPDPMPDDDAQIVADWKAQNTWFGRDEDLTILAEAKETQLFRAGMPLEERLRKTTEYVRQQMPHKFRPASQRPAAPAAVNGSRRNGQFRPAAKPGSYEALKPDARAACDRAVNGSGGRITREKWLVYATDDMFQK